MKKIIVTLALLSSFFYSYSQEVELGKSELVVRRYNETIGSMTVWMPDHTFYIWHQTDYLIEYFYFNLKGICIKVVESCKDDDTYNWLINEELNVRYTRLNKSQWGFKDLNGTSRIATAGMEIDKIMNKWVHTVTYK